MNLEWEEFSRYLYTDRKLDRSCDAHYRGIFKQITNWFDGKELTKENVIDYFEEMEKSGLSNSTMNQHLKTFKHLDRYLKTDCLRDFSYFKKSYKKQRILTPLEVEQILAVEAYGGIVSPEAVNYRYQTAIYLLSVTGMRVGELLKLKWGEVSQETITVRAENNKTDTERQIPITKETYERLEKLVKYPHGYVFGEYRGPMDRKSIANNIRQRARKAGITNYREVHPHSFRHYFVCHKLKDFPLDRISKIIGHADISTTVKYYAHYDDSLLRSVIEEGDKPETDNSRLDSLEKRLSGIEGLLEKLLARPIT